MPEKNDDQKSTSLKKFIDQVLISGEQLQEVIAIAECVDDPEMNNNEVDNKKDEIEIESPKFFVKEKDFLFFNEKVKESNSLEIHEKDDIKKVDIIV